MNHSRRSANQALVIAVLGAMIVAACVPLPAPTSELTPAPITTAAPQPETSQPTVAPHLEISEPTAVPQLETIEPTAVPQPQAGGATAAPQLQITEPTAVPSPAVESVASPPLEGTLWALVSYADQDGQPVDVLAETEPTAQFQDGEIGGDAGCNTYFGNYSVDGDKLTVKVSGATMMACPDPIMAQESAYLANLGAAATFVIAGDQLEIADADGTTVLIYVAVQPTPLTGTLWRLTSYNNGEGGVTSILVGTQITATFGTDGMLAGTAGCNNYSAGYTTDGNSIKIEAPIATRMFCAEPSGVMDQETAYLGALPTAARHVVQGDKLELRDADDALVASYSAAPEEEMAPVIAEAAASEIVGVVWRWVTTIYGDRTKLTPENPENYTLQLMPGREVRVLADCNVASGTYTLDGNKLSIEVAATTRMACPPGSASVGYLKDLNLAQSYVTDGRDLIIVLQSDTGSMRFEPAQPATEVELTATPEPQATEQPTSEPSGAQGLQALNVIWEWEAFSPPAGQPTVVNEPTRYEFLLLPDGKMRLKADCNTGSGTYQIDGSSITIVVGALTRVACPPDSLSAEFVEYLNQAATYRVEGERLFLDLKADDGTMEFSQGW